MKNLVDSFHTGIFRRAMLEATLIGAIAAVVGVHVVLRRLSFFVVAMSHATFPGVVLASVIGFSLFVGGTGFGLLVVAVVLLLGAKKALDDASIVGVVLAGSFALGVLLLSARPGSSTDLSAFLVGDVLNVKDSDVMTTAVVGVVVLLGLALVHKEIMLGAFDRTGASALGYRTWVLDGIVLVAVTVVMSAAVPAVGTLLAVALLTVPAMAARVWTDRIGPTFAIAAGIGALSGVVGLSAAAIWSIAAGGAIALTTGACFVISVAATSLRAWLLRRQVAVAPLGAA
ncbi:MAG TPA: metal ABC transporter permease [Ilumatobacteraceae bacterium]|jgi:manganese/iron transport system permease protein